MRVWSLALVMILSLIGNLDATSTLTLPDGQFLKTTMGSDIQQLKSSMNVINSTLLDFMLQMRRLTDSIATLPGEKKTIQSDVQQIISTITTLNSTLEDITHTVGEIDKQGLQMQATADMLEKVKAELQNQQEKLSSKPFEQQYDAFTLHNIHNAKWDDEDLMCPKDGDNIIISNAVGWNTTDRAYKTLPPGLRLAKSTIPNAGTGVFTNVFIPKGTYFGPYDGHVIYDSDDWYNDGEYVFHIMQEENTLFYRDAGTIEMSSWTRFINCARDFLEINAVVKQCRENIYFRTIRNLEPGSELFFFYGWEYAKGGLNMTRDQFCKGFNGTIHGTTSSNWICEDTI